MKNQNGVTIFELLIILSIIALATASVAPSAARSKDRIYARAQAEEFSSRLKLARSQALRYAGSRAIEIDIENHVYRERATTSWTPIGKNLSVEIRSGTPTTGDNKEVIFYPDGSSSGGEIVIGSENHRWRVKVGVDGKVSVDRDVEAQSAR